MSPGNVDDDYDDGDGKESMQLVARKFEGDPNKTTSHSRVD